MMHDGDVRLPNAEATQGFFYRLRLATIHYALLDSGAIAFALLSMAMYTVVDPLSRA